LANIKSAAKRARQAEGRRQHNVALRSRMRTAIKKVQKAAADGNAEQATSLYKEAVPQIDRMVSKGIIHKNNAARTKSRLSKRIKSLGTD
jgi:small subunit ribosomal protein S20